MYGSCTSEYDTTLSVTAGQDYHVVLGTYRWASGSFFLSCTSGSIPPQPDNEACTGATSITDGTTSFTPVSSSVSTSNLVYDDQWFKYTSTCAGNVIVSLTSFDRTVIQILRANACGSTPTVVDTAYPGYIAASNATIGEVLYIRAGLTVASQLTLGPSTFNVKCQAAPVNDNVAGATRITGTGDFPFDTTGATAATCDLDVHFIWTATCTGFARTSTCGLVQPTRPPTATENYVAAYLRISETTGAPPSFSPSSQLTLHSLST